MVRKITIALIALLICSSQAIAQCAMCRATLENNVSNGEAGIGAGINFGILYLFVMPYIAISLVAYFWYKNSKNNASKIDLRSYYKRKMS